MNCQRCDGPTERLLDLPKFPLTEKYEPWEEDFEGGRGLVDQAFLYCERCSHGRLEKVVPDLYGSDYLTSTGKSQGAQNAVQNFSRFVDSFVHSGYDLVIDIGANDSTLLEKFDTERVAVDPNARGNAFCITKTIEDADLGVYANRRKLILSSHTIEHLERPEVLVGKAAQIMAHGDHFALQCPSLELLVKDARIDQIHHQHIHYFSERSLGKMLYLHGLEPMGWHFDDTHWGGLMVIARKGLGKESGERIESIDVQNAIRTFTNNEIHIPQGAIAYGAALMLPVLAYWFPELDAVSCIVDDDTSKNGLRYINFNKKIICGHGLLEGADVVITAIGSKAAARELTRKSIESNARRIILPMHTI